VDPTLSHIHISRSDVDRFNSVTRLNEYKRLVASYQRQKEDYEAFQQRMASGLCSKTADRQIKGVRQELTIGVTTTINMLSKDNVGENLTRLGQLLNGDTVIFRNSRLSIRKHPDAKEFCCELIARTLVKQAENVVSVQPDMAYPLASVAVSLSVSFPRVDDFLKAIVASNCLFLVPYYIPRGESDSDQDYFTKLGYQRDSKGELEKPHLFLKRIGGICRFWTAMICTPAVPWDRYPRNLDLKSQTRHPLDFNIGWSFLANVVQLAPRTDITATILFEFLEIASHFLKKIYGRQFEKLLRFIHRHYMPEILAVSSAGTVARLKSFLESGSKRYSMPDDYPKSWRR